MERAKRTDTRPTPSPLHHTFCYVLAGCMLLAVAGTSWAGQALRKKAQSHQPDPLEALQRDTRYVKDGNIMMGRDLERIADAHETQAIPFLEQIFTKLRTQTIGIDAILSRIPPPSYQNDGGYEASELNLQNELHVANVLIRLGVHDDTYWHYLASQAKASLQINMPFNVAADALGDHNPPPNPEFLAWVKSHNMDKSVAAMYQLFVQPSPVAFLAMTRDPRGIPLLRQALTSTNPMIQAWASKGLAAQHDNASVPLIITACKKLPSSGRTALAESLLYFNDPQAQQYALLNLPKDIYLSVRQQIAQGHTPFN